MMIERGFEIYKGNTGFGDDDFSPEDFVDDIIQIGDKNLKNIKRFKIRYDFSQFN